MWCQDVHSTYHNKHVLQKAEAEYHGYDSHQATWPTVVDRTEEGYIWPVCPEKSTRCITKWGPAVGIACGRVVGRFYEWGGTFGVSKPFSHLPVFVMSGAKSVVTRPRFSKLHPVHWCTRLRPPRDKPNKRCLISDMRGAPIFRTPTDKPPQK